MEGFHRPRPQSDVPMYSGSSMTKGKTSAVPESSPLQRRMHQCVSHHSWEVIALHTVAPFLRLRRTISVSLALLVVKIIASANHATGCAVIKRHSSSLFARSLFMCAQAGWILISCGLTTNTEHNVCTALQATAVSWPFGRNLCTCVLLFPLPKLSQTSLLF